MDAVNCPKSLYDSYCFFSSAKFLWHTKERATSTWDSLGER